MSKNNKIAFQGVEGAHSDLACRAAYPYMDTVAYASFDSAMAAVEKGEVKYCMIPVENSQAGRVAEIHNLLPKTPLYIVGEHFQPVEHCLIAPKGTKKEQIKAVYSHPQALMQCKTNIQKHGFASESYANTAIAARDVAQWNDPSKAALASSLAAELYRLEIIESNFEDAHDNTTTFLAMGKEPAEYDYKKDRVITTLLITARNIPAALYKALGGFATNNVNLLKLESYIPMQTSKTAQFFVMFEGAPEEKNVQLAVEELGFFCKKVKVLGTYVASENRL